MATAVAVASLPELQPGAALQSRSRRMRRRVLLRLGCRGKSFARRRLTLPLRRSLLHLLRSCGVSPLCLALFCWVLLLTISVAMRGGAGRAGGWGKGEEEEGTFIPRAGKKCWLWWEVATEVCNIHT